MVFIVAHEIRKVEANWWYSEMIVRKKMVVQASTITVDEVEAGGTTHV